jgi:hypothetical protein
MPVMQEDQVRLGEDQLAGWEGSEGRRLPSAEGAQCAL